MTFIQHNRGGLLVNWILGALVVLVAGFSIELVFLYNRTGNLQHQVSSVKDDILRIETANAEMKEEIFALFNPDAFQAFAQERGLVQDRDPRYFEVDRQWSIASHR
jgi:cell division protein FtsL